MSNWIKKIPLSFILLDNFLKIEYSAVDFRAPYVLYLLYIFFYVFFYRKVVVERELLFYTVVVISILSAVVLLKDSGHVFFIKQTALISLNLCFAYLLINAYTFDIEALIKDYIQLITIASWVGLIQGISLIFNFYYGSDYSYLGFEMGNFGLGYTRIQSWFEEPSAMAYAFMPVIFICIAKFFHITNMISTRKALFILAMFLLTQSSAGLLGLLFCIIIIISSKYSLFKKPHYVTTFFILSCLIGYSFYMIPLVKLRVDDTLKLFFDKNVSGEDINRTNLSTYALYSNFKVTVESFSNDPLFGSGLGTHELNYGKYIYKVVPENNFGKEFQLNKKDANSLLLRVMSEMGLFGLCCLFWFLFSNKLKLNLKTQSLSEINYWVINNGIFVLILVRMLRQGHYTVSGFVLFLLIFYLTKKKVHEGSIPSVNAE